MDHRPLEDSVFHLEDFPAALLHLVSEEEEHHPQVSAVLLQALALRQEDHLPDSNPRQGSKVGRQGREEAFLHLDLEDKVLAGYQVSFNVLRISTCSIVGKRQGIAFGQTADMLAVISAAGFSRKYAVSWVCLSTPTGHKSYAMRKLRASHHR